MSLYRCNPEAWSGTCDKDLARSVRNRAGTPNRGTSLTHPGDRGVPEIKFELPMVIRGINVRQQTALIGHFLI